MHQIERTHIPHHYTDLRLHDLDSAVNQLSLPVEQPVELRATGTDDPSQTITETVTKPCTNERKLAHFSANACEVHGRNMSDQTKHKPRSSAGLCDAIHDDASKRVRRFERPTFTLAT